MGFFRQEYWSGLPCPPPGDLPDPGIKPMSPVAPALQVDSFPAEPPRKPYMQDKKQQLELGMEQEADSKLGREYVKAVYCHPAYLTYMQSTS